ncbi:hypothetical protein Ahy_A07g032874 [Arachis hypogaea]|uniref:Protein FAR1-RELATED SEQUENCE n=1 Tax=Arachis hypogaea TaxID=3818 RepID=A0A445C7V1_ARAHY|nr:hypothetical protein Ahy_A07g032874 [Arachis hypogaea]
MCYSESFDGNWNDFLMKYGVEDNKWLSELFKGRHLWILVYLDHTYGKLQAQFRGKVNCIIRSTQSALGYMISNSIFNKFMVTYNLISFEVKWQCLYSSQEGYYAITL